MQQICLIISKERRMGKEKYQKKIKELFEKSAVVDAGSIARTVGSKKPIRQYDKQLIRNLLLKGKIKRLAKGCYTKHEDPSLAVFCFGPAYLGLQDALSFHNLWDQETIPVIITARKARQGVRKTSGANVLVRRIDKKYLFGFEYYQQGSFYLPYSNAEKTFIDMAYFKETLNEDQIKSISKKINKKKLKSYLKPYPTSLKKKISRLLGNK